MCVAVACTLRHGWMNMRVLGCSGAPRARADRPLGNAPRQRSLGVLGRWPLPSSHHRPSKKGPASEPYRARPATQSFANLLSVPSWATVDRGYARANDNALSSRSGADPCRSFGCSSLVRCGALRHPGPYSPNRAPVPSEDVRALPGALPTSAGRGFGLFGGEDQGHLRGALALFAAHSDVRAAVRAGPELAALLRHGPLGAAVGAGDALLPREPRQAVQLFRKPSLPSHAISLSYPDKWTLPVASIHPSAWKGGARNFAPRGSFKGRAEHLLAASWGAGRSDPATEAGEERGEV
jgi:hypothetical protein